jgi:hypothetical protein
MSWRRATLIVAGFAGIFVLLSGCASVKSTAIYYSSIQDYPAKPLDAAIPILTRPPAKPYKVTGRIAFESDRGRNFLRKSMIYNAQIHGADACRQIAKHAARFRSYPRRSTGIRLTGAASTAR